MAIINNLILKEKTGASTWADRATLSNPTPGTYSAGYAFAAGLHAIKCAAQDSAGNSADSSIIVFQSGNTTKLAQILGLIDNIDPLQMTYTTDFSHTNDPQPSVSIGMDASNLSVFGESAIVPVGSVSEFKLWIAWKPYVEPNTKAVIDYAQDNVGTHATVGGSGQIVISSLTGVTKEGNYIKAGTTPVTAFLGNRIYTFGAKWKDAKGVWSPANVSGELSLCIDIAAPAVTITAPQNGYIYNGDVTTVTGNVSDTLA